MTDKNLTLETIYGDCEPEIGAPPIVVIKKNNKIKWKNDLQEIGGRPNKGETAKITLYEVTDTGNVPISAEDFCDGYAGGDQLIIPGKGQGGGGGPGIPNSHNYNCEVIFEGDFKYDVEAVGHQKLDPVIIIQPPPTSFMFPGLAAVIGAIIFFGVGHYVGFLRGSNQKQKPTGNTAS